MTNYREILRLYSLGLNKTQIAEICGYSRNTVAQTIVSVKPRTVLSDINLYEDGCVRSSATEFKGVFIMKYLFFSLVQLLKRGQNFVIYCRRK